MTRRAFTLVEILLAVFILGIGVLGVAALLPSAIAMQQRANDDVMGPIVADNAMAVIRSKLRPEMFGRLEDFDTGADLSASVDPVTGNGTIAVRFPNLPGDWGWKRPTMLVSPLDPAPNVTNARLLGAIDIFGGTAAYGSSGLLTLSETPSSNIMKGIPYNRRFFDPMFAFNPASPGNRPLPPAILIMQGERYYPMASEATYPQPRPQYVWDCMFRRFEGRILVAIFVYRVSTAGGDLAIAPRDIGNSVDPNSLPPYRVGLPNAGPGPNGRPPAIPMCVTFANGWRYGGVDVNSDTTFDNAIVPGTNADASGSVRDLPLALTWQAPGQWIVDEFNVVHKVASGRRNTREGPVVLTRAIPELEPTRALFGPRAGWQPNQDNMSTRGVTMIWFVPTRDPNGLILQPVYATVKEL